MKEKRTYIYGLVFFICFFSAGIKAQVSIDKQNDHWSLIVDGKPFEIKGVTFGYDKDLDKLDYYFKDLKSLGVNTIRLWGTNATTIQLLDAAQKQNIKVMVGIWMRHGRPGMEDDDSFNYLEDTAGMEAMFTGAIQTVEAYKNHPAVLTWAIGNEVYLNMATDAEKKAYSLLLERIAGTIKKIDPHHPVTSVEAWTFGLEWWQKYVPSIDIYGLNSYGAGANYLAAELEKRAIDKPYVVTEFGVTGEWDIQAKRNNIVVEPTDKEKYNAIAQGYHDWIKNKPNCLGVYVFHYANGNDFGSPWLFTHHRGMFRPQYWAIREAFTGEKPTNNYPEIQVFDLPDSTFKSETWIPVRLKVTDFEKENLEVSFFYNQRTGSRKRRSQLNPLLFRGDLTHGFEVQLPHENGAIKIYVNVKDTYSNVGIASSSIVVTDEIAKQRKYLVPKGNLPFWVYNDHGELPYFPSGLMGNYKAVEVDLNYQSEVYSGKSCIRISYKAMENWYGVAFVNPANDWGDILGGYDISGAKTFSFRAKSDGDHINATVGFGLIEKDKPFPDSGKSSMKIVLTKKWKKYTIKTKKMDLSCIRTGFVIFSNSNGLPHNIYIDNIVFN